MFQQVCSLVKNFQALRTLKRPVLRHHALVLMWICQVGYVMSTSPTLVSSFCPDLQRGLWDLGAVLLLLLTELPTAVLAKLGMLVLLLL